MCSRVSLLFVFLVAGLAPALNAQAGDLTFTGRTGTHLLELFTSEGCSSCPPAETWLGRLKSDGRLWQDFIPIAFHVDYWDRLEWKDRFAQSEWTQRQRAYANKWGSSSLYTPGFVLDGREWQDWSGNVSFPTRENAGLLAATVNGNLVTMTFQAAGKFTGGSAHVAWLGFNLSSDVRAGENAGRSLRHDFVVMRHATGPLVHNGNGLWKTELNSSGAKDDAGAIACWIETDGVPIQAIGGWLPEYRKS
ncbi:MAG: DUF1223 domain-containing protein [Verrucomicrobia bacterium]|nr:MAG: DUF1223 domain-containing protein [Verrucomicrobiota bacterium]